MGGKIISIYIFGQIAGLIGLVLMCCSVVLGARIKFLEDYFYSQNKVYVNHHFIGIVSFILILLHPILLATKFINGSFEFIWVANNLANSFGIMAFWLMMFLLFITFYKKVNYKNWYFTHKFLSLVYIFAGVHWLIVSSDVSINIPLRIFILAVYLIGVLAIIYRTLIPKIAVKKYDYKIIIKKVFERYLYLKLEAVGEKMSYKPGQFIFMEVLNEVHPFSLASNDEFLELIIGTTGDWTIKLKELQINTIVKIEGPFGKFGQDIEGEEVWIAGGLGIVPFIGLVKNRKDKKITLYYSVRNRSDIINEKEIMENVSSNFKVIFIESNIQGRLTCDQVLCQSNSVKYLLCGPLSMVKSMKKGLLKLGVNPKNIISEEFYLR